MRLDTVLWAALLLLAVFDLVPLVRQRSWRAVAAFLVFFLPALALVMLSAMKVEYPDLLEELGKGIKSIGLSVG